MRVAPIAIFAFNRPDNLTALLESLELCPEFPNSDVYFFIDGARDSADAVGLQAVRKVIYARRRPGVYIIESDTNKGLKRSLVSGISQVLKSHDSVIVLEDDLVLAPGALKYFNDALQKYSEIDRVWSISGYNYDIRRSSPRTDAVFLPFCLPWGWATWRRAWLKHSDSDGSTFSQTNSDSFRLRFDAGVRDFSAILNLDRSGEVNSWFINWYLEMFLQGGVALFPPTSLVTNQGMRGGTHANRLNPYYLLKPSNRLQIGPIELPNEIRVDFAELDRISKSFDARIQRGISALGRARRKLRRLLKGSD